MTIFLFIPDMFIFTRTIVQSVVCNAQINLYQETIINTINKPQCTNYEETIINMINKPQSTFDQETIIYQHYHLCLPGTLQWSQHAKHQVAKTPCFSIFKTITSTIAFSNFWIEDKVWEIYVTRNETHFKSNL